MLNHIFMSSLQRRCGNRYTGLLCSLGRLAERGGGGRSLKPRVETFNLVCQQEAPVCISPSCVSVVR